MRISLKFLLISLFTLTSAFSGAATLDELLPEKLFDAQGNEVDRASLQGKVVAIYFSAQWCPPCRAFTPTLVNFRNENAENFEVVFVSSDRTAEAQTKYMVDYKMDFLAVAYDSPQRAALGQHFGVRGIPTLIILDDQGNIITRDGRGDLMRDAAGALAAWKAKIGG